MKKLFIIFILIFMTSNLCATIKNNNANYKIVYEPVYGVRRTFYSLGLPTFGYYSGYIVFIDKNTNKQIVLSGNYMAEEL